MAYYEPTLNKKYELALEDICEEAKVDGTVLAVAAGELVLKKVTGAEVDDGAVTGAKLAGGAVTDAKVAAGAAIAEAKVSFDETAGHAHDGSDSAALANGAVATDQLAAGAVTEAKLAGGAVTDAKVAAGAAIAEAKVSFDEAAGHAHDGSDSAALAAASIPNLAASKITSGTFDAARVDKVGLPELSSEGYEGVTIELTAAKNISAYDMIFVDGSGEANVAQADNSGTMPAVGIAVAAATTGNTVTVLIHGRIRENDWAYTAGAVLYVDDTTDGPPTETQPATSGDQIQRVGVALASDNVLINVSPDVIEVE